MSVRVVQAISLSATRTLREQLSAISYQLKRYAHATRTAISYQLSA
ncbi:MULTISPECIES: hypothetical protein [unclassified Moorena]|nr:MULTISPECIES: hypothetical protein [unclassified Moorena]NEO16242.1 hypothetical protein [Moorena sp. SIO3E8]NEQ02102.1 hypothetical protein [Moorena sp. SIO3F7]